MVKLGIESILRRLFEVLVVIRVVVVYGVFVLCQKRPDTACSIIAACLNPRLSGESRYTGCWFMLRRTEYRDNLLLALRSVQWPMRIASYRVKAGHSETPRPRFHRRCR